MKFIKVFAESLNNQNEPRIEKATLQDETAVRKMYKILEDMHMEHRISLLQFIKNVILRIDDDKKLYTEMIKSKDMNIYLLKVKNNVKGLLNLRYNVEDHKCFVSAIVTNTPHKGYGQLMINFAINQARENNCRYVELRVSDFNTNAFEFYKKNGFKVLKVDGDARIMRKSLID